MAGSSPGAIRRALTYRDLRFLLASFSTSAAGDWLYGVALAVYIIEETGSAAWVAVATLLRLLPYAVLGSIGGDIADRFPRRTVMIASDLTRAALMFALALAAAAGAPVTVVVGIAVLATAAGTPHRPALMGTTPTLVEEDDLAAANGAMSVVENVAITLGPATGALLLAVGSPILAFGFNGLTFLASAGFVLVIRSRPSPARSEHPAPLGRRILEGIETIRATPGAALVVGLIVAWTFNWGQNLVLFVLVSDRLLGAGGEGLGLLYAAMGVGGLAAAGLTGRLAKRHRMALALVGSFVLSGGPLAALALVRDTAPAYLLMVVLGAGGVILDLVTMTMLQRAVPEKIVSRVFGLLDAAAVAAMLIGTAITPVLVEALGLRWTLAVSGLAVVGVALLAWPGLASVDRATARRATEVEPRVRLIESLRVFDGAPRQVLEELAAAAEEVPVAPGEVVIRQGERPDALYVIASGRFDVVASQPGRPGRPVATRTEGYFGEIGLMEGVPRTATVIAAEDGVLYRIDGQRFLAAVNRSPSVIASLRRGITDRRLELESVRPRLSGAET
jgi:MFS family permease